MALSEIEKTVLSNSLDKLNQPISPSLKKALSKNSLDIELEMRGALKQAMETHGASPQKTIIATLLLLKKSSSAYMRFLKKICSDVAFLMHLECNRAERSIEQAATDVLGQMDDGEPPIDPNDVPLADINAGIHNLSAARANPHSDDPNGTRNVQVDSYAAAELPFGELDAQQATDIAVDIQQWLSVAISKFTPTQLDRNSCPNATVPFTQLGKDDDYRGIIDFGEARSVLEARWEERKNNVNVDDNIMEIMLQSA